MYNRSNVSTINSLVQINRSILKCSKIVNCDVAKIHIMYVRRRNQISNTKGAKAPKYIFYQNALTFQLFVIVVNEKSVKDNNVELKQTVRDGFKDNWENSSSPCSGDTGP